MSYFSKSSFFITVRSIRQLLVCVATGFASSTGARRLMVGNTPVYVLRARESAPSFATQDYTYNIPSGNIATGGLPSRDSSDSDSPSHDIDIADELPVVNTAHPVEKFDHHEEFLGPSVGDIFGAAELTPDEVVVIVGSGLGPLMEASLRKTHDTGLQEFRDVSLAMIHASRKVLENRVANGIPVSEERFENLRKVEERMSDVLGAIAATFDENEHTVYSLSRFFKDFDFDPVERSKYLARVLPIINRSVFQVDDTTTAEKLRDAFNIFLPATRKFLEERIEAGKPVTQRQIDMLERAERVMPALMQAFVTVVHEPLLINFMQKLNLDPKERAKYLVTGFFASMDAIFKDPNASMAEMMRDSTLAFMPASRQVLENRLAEGKPVTQENFDNLERMEKTLPIILDAYVQMIGDLGIP